MSVSDNDRDTLRVTIDCYYDSYNDRNSESDRQGDRVIQKQWRDGGSEGQWETFTYVSESDRGNDSDGDSASYRESDSDNHCDKSMKQNINLKQLFMVANLHHQL